MSSKAAGKLVKGDVIMVAGRDWVVSSHPARDVYDKTLIAFAARENKVGGAGTSYSFPADEQVTMSGAPNARARL